MRGHETDRLTALRTELNRSAATHPRPPTRLCTSRPGRCTAGLAGLRPTTGWPPPAPCSGWTVDGVQVDDIATTGKTLPDFAGMWDPDAGQLDRASRRSGASTRTTSAAAADGAAVPARKQRPDHDDAVDGIR